MISSGAESARAGRLDEAEFAFRRAVNGRPDLGLARMNLASVYVDRASAAEGELSLACARKAESLLRAALECPSPAPLVARFMLGRVLLGLGRAEEARAELQRFLESGDGADPFRREAEKLLRGNPDVAREYACECLALGRGEEAVAIASKAMELDPRDAGLQANLGLALLVAGNVAGAERAARAALERAPEDEITRGLLSLIGDVQARRRARPTRWP